MSKGPRGEGQDAGLRPRSPRRGRLLIGRAAPRLPFGITTRPAPPPHSPYSTQSVLFISAQFANPLPKPTVAVQNGFGGAKRDKTTTTTALIPFPQPTPLVPRAWLPRASSCTTLESTPANTYFLSVVYATSLMSKQQPSAF